MNSIDMHWALHFKLDCIIYSQLKSDIHSDYGMQLYEIIDRININ